MKKATRKRTKKPGNHKYGPHMVKAAVKLAAKGCTNEEISESIGVALDTFYNWRKRYPELDESISDARLGDLDEIEAAMAKKAKGYQYDEVTTETLIVNGAEVGEKKVRVTKKTVTPSESAGKYLLNNRRRARWSEKIEAEVSGGLSIEIGLPESLGGSAPSEPDSEEA